MPNPILRSTTAVKCSHVHSLMSGMSQQCILCPNSNSLSYTMSSSSAMILYPIHIFPYHSPTSAYVPILSCPLSGT